MDPLTLLALGGGALLLLSRKPPSPQEPKAQPPAEGSALASPAPSSGLSRNLSQTATVLATATTLVAAAKSVWSVLAGLGAIGAGTAIVAYVTAGVFILAVTLFVWILLNPHAVKPKDAARDEAIKAYTSARSIAYDEAHKSLLPFKLAQWKTEVLSACFADGFIRTQDAIAVNALRLEKAVDLEGQRLEVGVQCGFEAFWEWPSVLNKNAVLDEVRKAKSTRNYAGGVTFSTNPGVYGKVAQKLSSLTRYQEPAFPTLLGTMREKWAAYLTADKLHRQTRVAGIYRRADAAAGFQWTYVHEDFFDTDEGRAFYDFGARTAWGCAYVMAMRAHTQAGRTPEEALALGKKAGAIHPNATAKSLAFDLGGQVVEFDWQAHQAHKPAGGEA